MAGDQRFIADMNVGKLAKWLRVLGYDAAFVNPISDNELVRRGLEEGRIVLTKDRGIAARRLATQGRLQVLLVPGNRVEEQLRFVVRTLDLDQRGRTFTRCIQCNVPLEAVEREAVRGLVPPYVFTTQRRFSRCLRCHKLYWPGTHWERMRERLQIEC
ncbi:MAG: Mut7-C RNAse domain-containing protein [Chloroflexi bacterium]|nr:Mut7-C RNAse domain-containing protein [Chloroflexota bacterium]